MTNRIALIRHGQTEWSRSGQHTSTTDIDLTDEGVHQAMTIPSLLWGVELSPVTVWSSPRLRAQRTATLAGLHIDEVVPDLAYSCVGLVRRVGAETGHVFSPGEGIVGRNADETIRNVGAMASRGMRDTDVEILNIMLHRQRTSAPGTGGGPA